MMEACPPALLEQDDEVDKHDDEEEEAQEEAEEEEWEDWLANDDSTADDFLCLFCTSRFASVELLFQHCFSEHSFNFSQLRTDLALQFYDCLRLFNFIRSQVACNTCWSCGLALGSQAAFLQHSKNVDHAGNILQFGSNGKPFWQDDKYLTPFLDNDSLLYSFEESLDDDTNEEPLSREDVKMFLDSNEAKSFLLMDEEVKALAMDDFHVDEKFAMRENEQPGSCSKNDHSHEVEIANGGTSTAQNTGDGTRVLGKKKQTNGLKVSFAEVAAKERYSINQSYFGSYSTFGIHREMISDKMRTDAYEHALTSNPSLLEGAVVMDLGCGTGILSLFAAKAGAKKVVAVEGSKRMALLAQRVAQANGFLNEHAEGGECKKTGMIDVVQGMIEELDLEKYVQSSSVDVLVSEWMGYCLLFESMLNSVLFARDRWLKPGGAILPDIAEMYVAGFGVGGTSMPFWENVYGFDMKCIGREVLEDAASSLIVDIVASKDVVTDSCLLQSFDLTTMTQEDVDFTASFELNPREDLLQQGAPQNSDPFINATCASNGYIWCYGIVVWFDTRFTSRFCRETPVTLSTSPYSPKTHWSQTLLTFGEPVCLSIARVLPQRVVKSGRIGTISSPALALEGRISIARSSRHRSIDISLEMVAVGVAGASQQWPVQIFDM